MKVVIRFYADEVKRPEDYKQVVLPLRVKDPNGNAINIDDIFIEVHKWMKENNAF